MEISWHHKKLIMADIRQMLKFLSHPKKIYIPVLHGSVAQVEGCRIRQALTRFLKPRFIY